MSDNRTISSSHHFHKKEFRLENANSSVIELISGDQAMEELQKHDDFIKNFSSFDVQTRLHSSSATLQDYFELLKRHILLWDENSCQTIASCIEYINKDCIDRLKRLVFPSRILVILTDGKDENNAAYCRNENVIVIPQIMITTAEIRRVFIHELFHIWSKWHTNRGMRERLYASIGYHPIPAEKDLAFPTSLSAVKITNPDAPLMMKYYINLKKNDDSDRSYKCTPILHASRPFNVNFSTNLFAYLVATTLILDDTTFEPLEPLEFLPYNQTSNFYEQIGNNTEYIIHPEEILAENFVLWMSATEHSELTTPAIIEKMNDLIVTIVDNTMTTF